MMGKKKKRKKKTKYDRKWNVRDADIPWIFFGIQIYGCSLIKTVNVYVTGEENISYINHKIHFKRALYYIFIIILDYLLVKRNRADLR